MDEIGRQALTNAFIEFTRNTSNPAAYRDSLIYDGVYPSNTDTRNSFRRKESRKIPKCPSAPSR